MSRFQTSTNNAQPTADTATATVAKGNITKDMVLAKLKEVRDFYMKFEGQPGRNPHFFFRDCVIPIEKKLDKKGADIIALYNEAASLPLDEKKADVSNIKPDFLE